MILQRWFEEVWNKGNEAAIDELLANDVVIHSLLGGNGERIYDVPTFKKMFQDLRSSFSEVQVTAEQAVSEGDFSAARCVITARRKDAGSDALRRSQPIQFTGMTMVRVRAGKIVESWNHFDFESMYQQME
jgi:predicted ester cyclase